MGPTLTIRDGEADTAAIAEYERSRRELVTRGLALGGAVVAAGAVPLLLAVRGAFAQAESDRDVLEAAIALERRAVVAYTAAADSGKLGGTEPIARVFAGQEQEHADGLTKALTDLGGSVPSSKSTEPEQVSGLTRAVRGDARDILVFTVELEAMAVAAYYDAQGKLEAAELIATVGSIMGNQAQHLVVLRQALARDPSPHAFVTGSLE